MLSRSGQARRAEGEALLVESSAELAAAEHLFGLAFGSDLVPPVDREQHDRCVDSPVTTVVLYGARWCPACAEQYEALEQAFLAGGWDWLGGVWYYNLDQDGGAVLDTIPGVGEGAGESESGRFDIGVPVTVAWRSGVPVGVLHGAGLPDGWPDAGETAGQ